MKPASAKAKGRKHQQEVAAELRLVTGLPEEDVRSTSMGAPGADIQLSAAAKELLPFAIECKSLASFAGYAIHDQATSHAAGRPGLIPVAVVRQNGRSPLVLLDWVSFLGLVTEAKRRSNLEP